MKHYVMQPYEAPILSLNECGAHGLVWWVLTTFHPFIEIKNLNKDDFRLLPKSLLGSLTKIKLSHLGCVTKLNKETLKI